MERKRICNSNPTISIKNLYKKINTRCKIEFFILIYFISNKSKFYFIQRINN